MQQTHENQRNRRTRELEILAAYGPGLFACGSISEICNTAGQIIHGQLGYTCTIFEHSDLQWNMRYVSMLPPERDAARNLTGLDPDDFAIPSGFEFFDRLLHGHEAYFLEDNRDFLKHGFQAVYDMRPEIRHFLDQGIDRIVTLISSAILPIKNHAVIVCPIVSGHKIFGNATVFGEHLSIEDVPMMKHFAALVGTAINLKTKELALNDSEAMARALINAPMDAAYLMDINGYVLECNRNGAQRFGMEPEQMTGKFLLDFFPPEVAAFRRKAVMRVIESGAPLRMEDERNGVWNDTVIYPITDSAGAVAKVAILGRDITLRKQTESQLRRSEENFRSLSEEITDGVAVHIDGKCYWCNRAFTEMFGVSREELMGQDIFRLIAPGQREEIRKRSRDRLDGKKVPSQYQTAGLRSDGSLIDVDVIAKKITFDDNLATLLVVRDITETRRADEALKKSERRYRSVIEDVDALICRFKPDGALTFVNEEYCAYFKATREELVGKQFFEFIPKEEREEVRERYTSLTRDNPTVTYEHRVIMPNGRVRWQRWTDRAIFDDQGTLAEYQSIGFDTTEERMAEERITALSRMLITSQEQERARLSRELHDEMGQQLSAIQLVLESMLSRPQPDRDFIDMIALRIEDLTIELRRICKGLRPVILDTFGFHMSLENLIHEFRDNFDLDIKYMPLSRDKYPLPPVAAISTYRIAQEALTNALRHAGGARITVRLRADRDQAQLEIEDEGPGFEISAIGASCLGLVGMRERAALCGADLIIDTAPGCGTRIALTVPLDESLHKENSLDTHPHRR